MGDFVVEGGTLRCGCGKRYHVSLFREVLQYIARRAYRAGRATEETAIEDAIADGYSMGTTIEREMIAKQKATASVN